MWYNDNNGVIWCDHCLYPYLSLSLSPEHIFSLSWNLKFNYFFHFLLSFFPLKPSPSWKQFNLNCSLCVCVQFKLIEFFNVWKNFWLYLCILLHVNDFFCIWKLLQTCKKWWILADKFCNNNNQSTTSSSSSSSSSTIINYLNRSSSIFFSSSLRLQI